MVGVLRIGLSGGIGSGKSTAARRLAEHGAVVIDADVLSREVVAPGTDGLAEIVAHFGAEVLDADGALDRPAMARRIFGDEQARAALSAIVHPRVATRTAKLMDEAPADAIVVHDIPLLVEAGYGPNYHLAMIVDAPVETRIRRLIERGLDESDARARMQAQATEDQRRKAADIWLDNSSGIDELIALTDDVWFHRLVPFEANIRARRPAPSTAADLVEYRAEWPQQARRLAARIEAAAGHRAVRVDHVGPTSIPGLAAEDVLDLQLTIRSLDGVDALVERLADAGFPPRREISTDQVPADDQNPRQWVKRCHASADPGRAATLHLRVAGNQNWRYALLLRDWLRTDTGARDEYGSAGSWCQAELSRADEWAQRTGWNPPAL